MKLKIWPEDASMLQMNDWLAELREDAAEPSAAGQDEPASGGAWPEEIGRASCRERVLMPV